MFANIAFVKALLGDDSLEKRVHQEMNRIKASTPNDKISFCEMLCDFAKIKSILGDEKSFDDLSLKAQKLAIEISDAKQREVLSKKAAQSVTAPAPSWKVFDYTSGYFSWNYGASSALRVVPPLLVKLGRIDDAIALADRVKLPGVKVYVIRTIVEELDNQKNP